MASTKLPSMAGRRALLNIAAGRSGGSGLSGMSQMGGLIGTMVALRRHGWITPDGELTDAGKTMVERLTGKPMESSHVA